MKRIGWLSCVLLVLGCSDPETNPFPGLTSESGTSDDEDDDNPQDDDNPEDEDDSESDSQGTGGPDDDSDGETDPTDDSDTLDPTETTGDETTGGDPNCYSEPLDKAADVADVVGAYGGADWKDDLIEAMDRRWPAGAYLLNEQRNDSYFDQFSDSNNWAGMVGWLDTLTHEETHLFNAYHAQAVGEHQALYFTADNILYVPPEQGFARSEIMPHLIPEAAAGIYTLYLEGSQGQRGFNAVLDELNCYENEVPGMAVFGEYYNGGISLRDGVGAFLYFLELYLRVARTDHPDFYTWAQGQAVYVDAVKTLWKRGHFFLEEVGDDFPNLGISDQIYRDEAARAENIAELEMFTGVGLEVGPCEFP